MAGATGTPPMSADVIPLADTGRIVDALREVIRSVEAGEVVGLALVAIHAEGGFFEPIWFGTSGLGVHGGSILRGAVCWLGAEMDAKARSE